MSQATVNLQPAKYYQKLADSILECHACARRCRIAPNATGFCGVRYNKNGRLYLLNYGRTISLSIDPIEKKPLYHFFPGKKILSISSLGCNFRCSFCQNWDISQFSRIKKKEVSSARVRELIQNTGYELTPQELVDYCKSKKIDMIAYTYNEPAISLEYYLDVMKLAHENDIKNVWVTNGYLSKESIDDICQYLDAANVDLKAFNAKFYKKHCRADIEIVKENIQELHNCGVWLELTTLVIPGENDSPSEITKLAEFIFNIDRDIPVHLSQFHPAYRMLDKPVTPVETLVKLYEICHEVGLNYVYLGNINVEPKFTNSYCKNCGQKLIDREQYKGAVVGLKSADRSAASAICTKCSTEFPGFYEL